MSEHDWRLANLENRARVLRALLAKNYRSDLAECLREIEEEIAYHTRGYESCSSQP